MTLRIDVSEVGDRIEEALASAAAGEEVVLERDGRAVAELRPAPGEKKGLRAFFESRHGETFTQADRDAWEEFARDVDRAREMLNRPVESPRWPETAVLGNGEVSR
jgi:antitoxin (DNA-binding transcriptional repressor) of toxin-antitoxin stability system